MTMKDLRRLSYPLLPIGHVDGTTYCYSVIRAKREAFEGMAVSGRSVSEAYSLRILRLTNDVTGDLSAEELQKIVFSEARSWKEEEGGTLYVNGAGDRLVGYTIFLYTWVWANHVYPCQNATHPVFNLTMTHVREVTNHFYKQG